VQIALDHPQKALIFIEPALASAREHGLTFRAIELMVSQSLAQEALGEHGAALLELQEALELAKPFGYARVFDEGPALDQLLLEIRQSSTSSEYIERLLASFHRTPTTDIEQPSRNRLTIAAPTSPGKGPAQGLVEPLSEREFDVLRLIAAGCSNAQIGARLYIAPGTVKRHITNLYGKLGVHTRTQAIVTASEKGLLP
jgi:LuxR family maltose regulon positive regulatory protein